MSKTSHINEIMQNLDTLTLAELLVIKAKVDALIEEKYLSLSYPLSGSYQRVTAISTTTVDSDILGLLQPKILSSSLKSYRRAALITGNKEHSKLNEYQVVKFFETPSTQNDSLEDVINLVNEWMADESDYDEKTYSSIEPALNQNQLLM